MNTRSSQLDAFGFRVEVFSSDVIRAEAKRKALRKKLLVLFVAKLVLSGAVYLAYGTISGAQGTAIAHSYLSAAIAP